ncbi:hypothetical protein BOTBODRAFT_114744 [Botryobasidium botryosum FD-172 SS1]|uniref:Carbonic anhydrase n=1 Tax=Botryobasidium botryosum (strain FD-172 SS1) TaxID=930990 RepID=A0A067M968_BOTB1|nr:hypothetical protein BOTBODRAFT_114744 [Botryobasidium botryosum FD-172 SS1]
MSHDIVNTLLKSNEAWAAGVTQKDPDFFKNSAENDQKPKVLWLGCSDSRVPESVVLAARPGDIFVHRNIGNQFRAGDDSTQSVLDFAVGHVEVQHIFVVGHSQCGACKASLKEVPEGSLTRFLKQLIDLAQEPHITGAQDSLQALVEYNVKQQVENVANSEAVRKAWGKKGREPLYVHGFVYRLESGRLEDLGLTVGPNL